MTNLVSVITPVYQPVPEFLRAAYESLAGQVLPDGWDWQWIVQEDGETGELSGLLPEDPRISFGHRATGRPRCRTHSGALTGERRSGEGA